MPVYSQVSHVELIAAVHPEAGSMADIVDLLAHLVLHLRDCPILCDTVEESIDHGVWFSASTLDIVPHMAEASQLE